jgi:very-short-patch-repair endonuclease
MNTALKTAATKLAREKAKVKREALELAMLQHIRAVKLDAGCVQQHRFHAERQWRFDFAWPVRRVALEVDGGTWTGGRHTRGDGYAEDCVKVNTAVIAGWRVLRATSDQVKSGEAVGWLEAILRPRPVSVLSALDEVGPGKLAHEKDKPVRSPTYLANVRKIGVCARCGRTDRPIEAAHSNRCGKGKSMKAGDNYTAPLCADVNDGSGVRGCHWLFDNYKLGSPDEQHEMSKPWIEKTYSQLKWQGQVPMNVPRPVFEQFAGETA